MNVKENVNVKELCTFKIGGVFRYFTKLKNKNDLKELFNFAKEKKVPVFILGGGSNVVFRDGIIDFFVFKIELEGFEIIKEDDLAVDIKVGAGEAWDEVVRKTVEMGFSGLEALSAIPGTVGATPVQNVGAYGSEVKDTILEVEVYDITNNQIKKLSNNECKFGYRDSIFKNEAKGKYVITAVIYRLSKLPPKIPQYPDTIKYFNEKNIENPTLKEIREALIFIRGNKLPNPKEIPNVGSFFKNPIIEKEIADQIQKEYPNAKFFPVDENHIKIPAGWLIENAGLKGKSFGEISVYEKNALVLINNGNATRENLENAKNEIIKTIQEKFGVTLEQEPETI